MIKVEQILPLLKKGWVAMDANGLWHWHAEEPVYDLEMKEWVSNIDIAACLNDRLDIEPVKDWTKSLMRCGDE